MGETSRGGNSGLNSSGRRQRNDKELRDAKDNPKKVGRGEGGGEGNSDGKGKSNRRGRLNGRGLNGLGIPGHGLPHLSGLGGTTAKKPAGKKAVPAAKHTPPPSAQKSAAIKKITRIKPTKVKLTKQRTNKAPN